MFLSLAPSTSHGGGVFYFLPRRRPSGSMKTDYFGHVVLVLLNVYNSLL
jgi:hypothetical protein